MSATAIEKQEKDAEVIEHLADPNDVLPEMRVYSHSNIFYWWPVWLTGFVMAIITYLSGTELETANMSEHIHPSASLGIVYVTIFFMTLVFTNFTFRGSASLGVGMALIMMAMAFALLGVWDNIFDAIGYLSVHMNLGFYVLTSPLLFGLWAYSTFLHIRFNHYRVRPGQLEKVKLIGDREISYDTRGAVVEKFGEDFFRHWILGLGSGDICISTSGAKSEELIIRNVLHVDKTISSLRKLTSVQPDSLMDEMGGEDDVEEKKA